MEGELSTARKIATGVPQSSVLAPVLYSLYINDATRTRGSHIVLIAADTCIYSTEKHERLALCKLKRGLAVVNSWYVPGTQMSIKVKLRRPIYL
jgi:hypothetical protein